MSEEAPSAKALGDGAPIAAAAVFVIVFGLGFGLIALLPIDVPVYVPLEHRWLLGMPQPPAIGMDFYGRVLLSLALALPSAGLAWALARFALRWRPAGGSMALRMLWLYALLATALPVFLYAYVLLFK